MPFGELFGAAGASEGLPLMLMTRRASGLVLQPPTFIVIIFLMFVLTLPRSLGDVLVL